MDRALDRILTLTTAKKSAGVNYQAEWDISDSFLNSMRNGYQIVLTHCSFSNLRWPTNESNNKIYFKEAGGGLLTGTILQGNYQPTEYAAAVEVALDAAGAATYTVTYSDTIRDFFTIASSSTVGFFAGLQSFNDQIGLASAQLGGDAASITGTMPYKLNLPAGLNIRCMSGPILTSYCSGGIGQVLASFGTAAGYGEDVSYMASDNDPIHVSGDSFRHIRLDIYDDAFNSYILPESVVVQYVLKIIPDSWSEDAPRKRRRLE